MIPRLRVTLCTVVLLFGVGCSDESEPAADTTADTEISMMCEGVTVPCRDRRVERQCVAGVGCTYRPASCSGNGVGCPAQTTQAGCEGVDSCVWSPDFCTGVAQECTLYIERTPCTDAPACVWRTSLP
ncbi:MAG: hypothetical protein ACI9MR_001049 [Myxococcota bacterium]